MQVHPGHVRDPAQVQKGKRFDDAHLLGAGKVIERRQRRALAAQLDILGAEIPDRAHAGGPRQRGPVTDLAGAPARRVVIDGLAVEPDQVEPALETVDQLYMALQHDVGGPRNYLGVILAPKAGGGSDHGPVLRRKLQRRAVPDLENLDSVGEDRRTINPVHRGSRHAPEHPKRLKPLHRSFLSCAKS